MSLSEDMNFGVLSVFTGFWATNLRYPYAKKKAEAEKFEWMYNFLNACLHAEVDSVLRKSKSGLILAKGAL